MALGTCTCIGTSDGSPCSHQLAVAIHYHKASLNCLSTLHPHCRKQLAYIALGHKANTSVSYYSSVSQVFDEQQGDITTISTSDECNFKTPTWARISEEGAKDVVAEERDVCIVDNSSTEKLSIGIRQNHG